MFKAKTPILNWSIPAKAPCKTCDGLKGWPNWVRQPTGYNGQEPYRMTWEHCPDCQEDSGRPTGLAMWELTKVCPVKEAFPVKHRTFYEGEKALLQCRVCGNEGRVLKDPPELDAGGRRFLRRRGWYAHYYFPDQGYKFEVHDHRGRWQPTEEAALYEIIMRVLGLAAEAAE